jgi:hypothetical protein
VQAILKDAERKSRKEQSRYEKEMNSIWYCLILLVNPMKIGQEEETTEQPESILLHTSVPILKRKEGSASILLRRSGMDFIASPRGQEDAFKHRQ